jgi:hypothetical protein
MTVEELINELSKLPNNTEVIVREDGRLGSPILTSVGKVVIIEKEEE